MPHFYPIVLPGGKSLAGDSLGFHAYSLRIDNLTNQWLLEETSLAWIPPYSLGVCLRLYGTGVGIILNQAPIGQPQLTPITGEQAVGVYSDQIRTEVAGSPVRQYSLVQAVSDLTQGPQPALPPVGVDRLYADASGNIHHLHSNGQDIILVDPTQSGVVTTGMILDGTIQNADLASGVASANIGTLGGVLTGTLPNPSLAASSITSDKLSLNMGQANLSADVGAGNLNNTTLWVPFSGLATGIYLFQATLTLQVTAGPLNVDAWFVGTNGYTMVGGVNNYKSMVAIGAAVNSYVSATIFGLYSIAAGNVAVQFQTTPAGSTLLLKATSPVGGWPATSAFYVRLG